jgi:hypothetical protein
MKYLIVKNRDNGYDCNCCRKEWIEIEEEDFTTADYSREEIDKINEEIKLRYPADSKIYRVAEIVKE